MKFWTACLACTLWSTVQAFTVTPSGTRVVRTPTMALHAIQIYGHPGTRSPLCNWGFFESSVGFEEGDLRENPHPFGQLPCLTDDDGVMVFESGAILLYLLSKLENVTPSERAAMTSWITWANASLDPICFKETPDGKVFDTGLRQPNKRIDTVDKLLSTQTFLLGDKFSLADVAVASYMLYVLQFFSDVDLSRWPHIVRYLQDCVNRPAYARAFGERVQGALSAQLQRMGGKASSGKKLFGVF